MFTFLSPLRRKISWQYEVFFFFWKTLQRGVGNIAARLRPRRPHQTRIYQGKPRVHSMSTHYLLAFLHPTWILALKIDMGNSAFHLQSSMPLCNRILAPWM